MDPLYLLGLGGLLMLAFGFRHQTKTMQKVAKRIPGKAYLPKTVHVLIVATQLYELVLVVEHASFATIAAAVFLLAVVMGSRSGTEDYLADFRPDKKSG